MEIILKYTEYLGATIALIYLFLEIKQHRVMWVMGVLSSILYGVVFMISGLYAMATLQLYFFIVSIYGWIEWSQPITNSGEPFTNSDESYKIEGAVRKRLPLNTLLISAIALLGVTLLLYYVLSEFSSDPAPFMDALITTMSMIATVWLSKKYMEQWYIWIIANFLSIILYYSQNMFPTSILYIVYFIASILGLLKWRKFPVVLK